MDNRELKARQGEEIAERIKHDIKGINDIKVGGNFLHHPLLINDIKDDLNKILKLIRGKYLNYAEKLVKEKFQENPYMDMDDELTKNIIDAVEKMVTEDIRKEIEKWKSN